MATKKLSSRKQSAAKAAPKVRTTKKTAKKQTKSFALKTEDRPFMSFQPTVQSFYWIVLGVVVIGFTAWIMKLQSDIQDIYDSIDANSNTVIMQPHTTHKIKH